MEPLILCNREAIPVEWNRRWGTIYIRSTTVRDAVNAIKNIFLPVYRIASFSHETEDGYTGVCKYFRPLHNQDQSPEYELIFKSTVVKLADGSFANEVKISKVKEIGGDYEYDIEHEETEKLEEPENREKAFREELEQLLNKYSKDNFCNIPDFMLADFLSQQLDNLKELNDKLRKHSGR